MELGGKHDKYDQTKRAMEEAVCIDKRPCALINIGNSERFPRHEIDSNVSVLIQR